MKIVAFSDTHLSKKFDQRKFEALKKVISQSERVIINGDFWEGLDISFEDFIKSEWNKLFPLLKEKKAIYVYGNHDCKQFSDKRVSLFCEQDVDNYTLNIKNQTYFFTHGHEFLFPKQTTKKLEKEIKQRLKPLRRARLKIAGLIQRAGFGLFGPKFFPNYVNKIPKYVRNSICPQDYILVCGHTHKQYDNKKLNFVDLGFFNYGWANYMEIYENGDYKLFSYKY